MRQKDRVRPSLIMAGFHYLLRLKPGSAGLRVYDERSEHIIIGFQQPIIISSYTYQFYNYVNNNTILFICQLSFPGCQRSRPKKSLPAVYHIVTGAESCYDGYKAQGRNVMK